MIADLFQSLPAGDAAALAPLWLALGFLVGTLISEDLTCIAAGLMVAHGAIGFLPAMLATLAGILAGDLLLYAAGRYLGSTVLASRTMRRVLKPDRLEASEAWFLRRGPMVILISRFVPGSRLPVYVAAGLLRLPLRRVAPYFALAGLLWTPVLVGLAAVVGAHARDMLEAYGRAARWTAAVVALLLWFVWRLVLPLLSPRGRRLLVGKLRRVRRWEFWPMWAFYPPVLLYLAWLALRHRSATLFTAANPAIPAGGFIGESKTEILAGLRGAGERVARWAPIPPGPAEERLTGFQAALAELRLAYPVVLKPDAGQRGEGVAIVRHEAEAVAYFGRMPRPALVQEYVPGQEFGVFYVRLPDEPRGRIFSVTEKRMPAVVGDGRHKLADLILRDERAVCMAEFYLARQAARAEEVVPAGERVQLVELGTHCRGAIFLNGAWVVTPALEAEIDRISQTFSGFCFGRYDIRTPDVAAFREGRGFKIVELNGVTAEATHIYDPANSLAYAHRVLREQWRLAFAIGAQNRARGAAVVGVCTLWRRWRAFRRAPEVG